MKKITNCLLALALVTVVGCSKKENTEEQDHLARIQEAGKIVVGLEGDWQPFSFHDESDTLVGFDVEVAQNIGERIGVEVEFVEAAWDGLFAGMESGRYDIVVNGVDITEDRQKSYDFSDPYGYDRTVPTASSMVIPVSGMR